MANPHTTLPFLYLAEDHQIVILSKMNNLEIIKLAVSCKRIKYFIEKYAKWLSSRLQYGDTFGLCIKEDQFVLNDKNGFPLYLTEPEFYRTIAPLSIKTLNITIENYDLAFGIGEILKKWNPVCSITYIQYVESKYIFDIVDNIDCSKFIIVDRIGNEEFLRTVQTLKKTRNQQIHSSVFAVLRGENIIESVRHYDEFLLDTDIRTVSDFYWDLMRHQNYSANWGRFDFNFSVEENVHVLFPPMLCIFSSPSMTPGNILKLTLGNKKCVLIAVSVSQEFGKHKRHSCIVLEDDDEQILDGVIGILGIQKSLYTEEVRAAYFKMDILKRETHLKAAVAHSRMINN